MSLDKDEILSLRKKEKENALPFMEPILLETLLSYPSFDINKFNTKLLENVTKANSNYNQRIENAKKKLKNLIDKQIASTKTKDIKYLNILNKLYEHMVMPTNLNKFENPLLHSSYLEDGTCGDISYDSSSGYDGDNNFDCWMLAKYTHSDSLYLCLQDIIHDKSEWEGVYHTDSTWSDYDLKENYAYGKTMKFLSSIGFKCWFVYISAWRKGYDYTVHDFNIISKDEYLKEHCVNEKDDFYRYYISFSPDDYE